MIGAESEAGWRRLLLALSGLAAVVFLLMAFVQPGTLHYDGWVIQDDARQFLAWTPRLGDPALLRGDLIADYWHSVSPPFYRLLFALPAAIGVAPLMTARLLPPILLVVTALTVWPVAMRLAKGRPPVAFLGAALVMALVVHEDSVWSATPRAVTVPLIFLFFDGLLAARWPRALTGLTLLALVYPAPALVCLGMLALSCVRTGPRLAIDLSPRAILLVAAGLVLTAVATLPLKDDTTRWRPIATLAQAEAMPSMALHSGRSSIVQANGRIGWICSPRMGFLPEIASCSRAQVSVDGLLDLLLFLPLPLLAWAALRSREPDDPRRLYLLALLSAAALWALAAAVAFRLHLPGRYSQRVLGPLELLAVGTLLGEGLLRLRSVPLRRGAIGLIGTVLLASFLTPVPKLKRPRDRAGIEAIARLPAGTLIAGVAIDLNMVPAATGRAVLATTEHAIPYELGYYAPFHARLLGTVRAVEAQDPRSLAAILARYRVDVLAVDTRFLATGRLPRAYRETVPEAPPTAPGPLALARAPARCAPYRGPAMTLFDAACLRRWAAQPSPSAS